MQSKNFYGNQETRTDCNPALGSKFLKHRDGSCRGGRDSQKSLQLSHVAAAANNDQRYGYKCESNQNLVRG